MSNKLDIGGKAPPIYCAYDELVELDKLKPHPRNPNTHPSEQIRLLAKIIAQQGWRAPITVSKRSGYIVRGHARLAAAKKAGFAYAPIDWQEYATDDAEIKDLIADNRIAALAEMDAGSLASLLADIGDPELAGFTDEAIEDLGARPEFIALDDDSGTMGSNYFNAISDQGYLAIGDIGGRVPKQRIADLVQAIKHRYGESDFYDEAMLTILERAEEAFR